jgi:pseudouridine synthase
MDRLQKVLAHAGVASRRKAEELIVAGRVRVNDKVVTELGTQADPARDRIRVDGKTIRIEAKRYVALYKPKGYLSDVDEGSDKPLAVDLVPARERLYPVGRLDANSEGLLLLTNDGDLAHRLTHPRYRHEKEYLVLVRGEPDEQAIARLRRGVWREGEHYRADRVERVGTKQKYGTAQRGETWLRIVLHEGKKREIRHMGAAVGHPVLRLIRVRIGNVWLEDLRAGKWRELNPKEIKELRQVETIHHRN